MGMDLWGENGWLEISREDWLRVLEVAFAHGWKPVGTVPTIAPEDPRSGALAGIPDTEAGDWDASNYSNNDYQIIPEEDGREIAKALDRALEATTGRATSDLLVTAAEFFRSNGAVLIG